MAQVFSIALWISIQSKGVDQVLSPAKNCRLGWTPSQRNNMAPATSDESSGDANPSMPKAFQLLRLLGTAQGNQLEALGQIVSELHDRTPCPVRVELL